MDWIYDIGNNLGFDFRYFIQQMITDIRVLLLFVCNCFDDYVSTFSIKNFDIIDYISLTFVLVFLPFALFFLSLLVFP